MTKMSVLIAIALSLTGLLAGQKDDIHEGVGIGMGRGIGSGCSPYTAAQHLKLLTDRMTLNGNQREEIVRILQEQLSQWDDARKDQARMRRLREASGTRVRDILFGEQKDRFDEIRREGDQNCSILWSLGK